MIIFVIDWLVCRLPFGLIVWSMKCQRIMKKGDILRFFVLSDHESKPQRYSVYYYIWQRSRNLRMWSILSLFLTNSVNQFSSNHKCSTWLQYYKNCLQQNHSPPSSITATKNYLNLPEQKILTCCGKYSTAFWELVYKLIHIKIKINWTRL